MSLQEQNPAPPGHPHCRYLSLVFTESDTLTFVSLEALMQFFSTITTTKTKIFNFYSYFTSGYMGAASCMILASWGSAWGTWRAGLGVCSMGIDHPAGVIKNIVPIVMAGVLGIYGLIVSVIITQAVVPPSNNGMANQYSAYNGYTHVSKKKYME